MKNCPKCKATIQEEARFCLYCMTSFEEKQAIENREKGKKWWLYIIAAVLVVALIALSFVPKGDKANNLNPSANTTGTTRGEQQVGNGEGNLTSATSSQVQDTSKGENPTTTNPTANTTTTGTTTRVSLQSNSSTSATTTTQAGTTTVTYIYRDAKYGDDFAVSTNLENSVVITGVKTTSANGEYKIPEMIDGKKVVAIMGLAFSDEGISKTVKKVIVPATVKTIWNYAFADCYNLTDIYFCGSSIYTESGAFPAVSERKGTLTIHCSANCSDRNYRYYKNSASYYGAEYDEWNG